ncbi:trans-sulfuration enzyme family protein [Actinomadura hibisca]|uniref:trans-sulfuration enzyme family protein n=1 Tax=Actinomadura hibisca TaxID=68565 RepID=UPI00082BD4AF|nr:PLP-dependent transferase [Actinomadura hibisca]
MRTDIRASGENTRAAHLPTGGLPGEPGDAFAAGLAALEGHRLGEPVGGQAFASGTAAATAVFLAFAGAGAHVVAPHSASGAVRALLTGPLARFGVQATFADFTDPAAVGAALRPATRLVWAETLAGPAAPADLPALAAVARQAGAVLAVESTWATPVVCRPLEHGADLVVHTATPYLGGHGGAVVARPARLAEVRRVHAATGAVLAPGQAQALRRALATLPLRVRRHCDTASIVAAALARHPAVASVAYPGLPGHPGHGLARELFDAGPEGTRFGAVVVLTPRGGSEAGPALVEALGAADVSGGARTEAVHLASTTYRHLDAAGLAAAGVEPGAVRLAVGLEDADDLIRALTHALDAVARAAGQVPRSRPAEPLVADPG